MPSDHVPTGARRIHASAPEPERAGGTHPGRTAAWLAKQVELGLMDVDLSVSQYRVLCLLVAGPAVASALADRLAVRRPSVTAIVEGLVNRGLVARGPVEDDRRRVSHTLTAEGYRVLAAADRAVDDRLETLAGRLGDEELARQAVAGLGLWQRAMLNNLYARQPTTA